MGKVSPEHLDALCEMDNITLGAAATSLEKASGIQVKMIKPKAKELSLEEALAQLDSVADKVFLIMQLDGDYSGKCAFVFSQKDISVLIEALSQKEEIGSEFDERLIYVGSQIGKSIVESLSMLVMKTNIVCQPVEVKRDLAGLADDVVFIEMQFKLGGGQVDSHFWHIIPVELGNRLASDMLGEMDAQLKEFEEKSKKQDQTKEPTAQEQKKQEQLKDIPDIMVQVAVRLASKKMLFQELWDLNLGSVIEFPQYVSQPVDVIMKNKVVAKAQVVTVGEKFGVRITEVKDYAKGISS